VVDLVLLSSLSELSFLTMLLAIKVPGWFALAVWLPNPWAASSNPPARPAHPYTSEPPPAAPALPANVVRLPTRAA
jgi:hypothetical protein